MWPSSQPRTSKEVPEISPVQNLVGKMKQKRSKLFIDPVVQGSLAKRIGIHWMVFFGIVVALQFITTWMLNPVLSFRELTHHLVQNNGLFLIALILLLPSFVFDTVKMSHRFAGPMLRLRNAFRENAEKGEFKEISFREGDFWSNMAEAYNAMVKRVHQEIGRDTETSSNIQSDESKTVHLTSEKTQRIS